MADLGTLINFTESSNNDYFILHRNGKDVKIHRSVFMDHLYPVGTVIEQFTDQSPEVMGYYGTWSLLKEQPSYEGRFTGTEVPEYALRLGTSGTVVNETVGNYTGTHKTELETPIHTHEYVLYEAGAHVHSYTHINTLLGRPVEGTSGSGAYTDSITTEDSTTEVVAHTHPAVSGTVGSNTSEVQFVPEGILTYIWERVL